MFGNEYNQIGMEMFFINTDVQLFLSVSSCVTTYLSDSGAIDTRRKGIQVKGENKALNLELNTEEETAKLTVDEDGLLIKDSIDMVSKGDMKVEGNNITVSGNENLDLNAKSKVSVQGAQVDLKN